MMMQRAILAEYEKIVGKEDPMPSAAERLRSLEQLKTDGLINEEEEYNTKRKEILEVI